MLELSVINIGFPSISVNLSLTKDAEKGPAWVVGSSLRASSLALGLRSPGAPEPRESACTQAT